ncbi:MAG TPA: DUF2332 domain-containing protein [Terriglobales bacterium]|nr:DUF2332 domain-containing protein [Terriglobales bacterium]
MIAPNEIVARRLLKQAEWCERLGSSLYSTLLRHAAEDVLAQGACCAVLHDRHDDLPGSALALRFPGAVHRLVLEGKAPQLAVCFPSAGGDSNCNDLWPRFRDVVQHQQGVLRELVHRPVQTNEVGRCAALLGGFLEVIRQTRLPLRLLEVGAAGGLMLRWDQYRYEAGDEGWGDSRSPVRITGAFGGEHPCFDLFAKIVERRGCDASPIDPDTEEGRLTLQSYVWPDQVERFRQLAAAIDVARHVPASVDQGNAPDWIETALGDGVPGVATVVYHSIVWQYLSNVDRARFERVVAVAGEAATHKKPLAWLRFEPADNVAEVRLQLWPGGTDRLLARSGFHGTPVHWLGRDK